MAKVTKPRKKASIIPGMGESAIPMAAMVAAASVDSAVAQIGKPTRIHLEHAGQLLKDLPDDLLTAAHEPFSACALIYGILTGTQNQNAILEGLKPNCHPAVFGELRNLLPSISQLDDSMRLPLVDLALPALKLMSRDQFERFNVNVRFLIEHDQQIDLFEYALDRIVRKSLLPEFENIKRRPIQYYSVKPLADSCAVVLSALASIGHTTREEADAAFDAGARLLRLQNGALKHRELGAETLPLVDQALNKLAESSPGVKKIVINALAHTVAADGKIAVREAELLRAIAESLDCPIPPFVDTQA